MAKTKEKKKSEQLQKVRLAVLTVSTALFPFSFYYLSPVVSIGAGSLGVIAGSVIVFLSLMVLATVLGRSFCSWVCPLGGLQDYVASSRNKRVPVKKISWMKYIVWSIWVAGLLFFIRKAGGVNRVDFAFGTERGISGASWEGAVAYGIVILSAMALSFIFGRRTTCHSLCWIAPFMVIGRKIGLGLRVPSLHLRTAPDMCVGCHRCTKVCPMSLDVECLVSDGIIADNSCILCGKCVDTCIKNTISWAWKHKN